MAKLGRPKKKRKYTKRVVTNLNEAINKASLSDTIFLKPPTDKVEQRASESPYVFIAGNKVLIRNLTDETLNGELNHTFIAACEARRLANQLEQLEYNLSLEQRFRGLK